MRRALVDAVALEVPSVLEREAGSGDILDEVPWSTLEGTGLLDKLGVCVDVWSGDALDEEAWLDAGRAGAREDETAGLRAETSFFFPLGPGWLRSGGLSRYMILRSLRCFSASRV